MTEILASTIESIYANIERDDGWDRIMSNLTRLTGAKSGCLVSAPPDATSSNVGCFHNIDPDWIEAYNDYYHQFDPTPEFMRTRPGEIRLDHVTGPRPVDTTGPRRTFFNEVMRPQQFRHTLALGLSDDAHWGAGLVLQRSGRQGAFSSEAVSLVKQISGHLRQALDLYTRLTRAAGLQLGMAAALENSPVAALLLDGQKRVVFVNQPAEALLANHSAVTICRKRFSARRVADNNRLQLLLQNAIRAGADASMEYGGKCLIENSIHLDIRPLGLNHDHSFVPVSPARVVVWLSDIGDVRSSPSADMLRRHYDLTPAEAELLSLLVKGKTLADIAILRSVKRETVRGQLKMIKSKFGVSRQADLVRIVLNQCINV